MSDQIKNVWVYVSMATTHGAVPASSVTPVIEKRIGKIVKVIDNLKSERSVPTFMVECTPKSPVPICTMIYDQHPVLRERFQLSSAVLNVSSQMASAGKSVK